LSFYTIHHDWIIPTFLLQAAGAGYPGQGGYPQPGGAPGYPQAGGAGYPQPGGNTSCC